MPTASVPPPAAEVLPAERERDPDVALRALAWLVVAFSLAQVLLFSFGRDQGIYAVVGSGILHGEMPYRDLWDFKPPGIFLVYASAFAVFGKSMIAPRLVEALCLFATVLGCRRLGGTLFDNRTAGLVGGAVAALLHAQLEFWHSAQPETFAGALTIAAFVLATTDGSRRRRFLLSSAVGLCCGACFLLKPTLAGPALVCACWMSRHAPPPQRGWWCRVVPFIGIAVGALLPIALCGLWFWGRGAWPDLAWTLGHFAPGYTRLSWVGRSPLDLYGYAIFEAYCSFSTLLTAGLLLALLADARYRAARNAHAWLAALVLSQLLGVAMQAKFFQYHYAASLPLLAISAGVGFHHAWRRLAVGSELGTLAFAAMLVALGVAHVPVNDVPLGFWQRSILRLGFLASAGRSISREELDRDLYKAADYDLAADRLLSEEVRRRLGPEQSLFIWGFEPTIYFLSERRPASRYIYDVPQRATWEAARARSQLLHDLDADPPQLVLVQHADVFPFVTGNGLGSGDALADFPELAARFVRDYVFVQRIDDFEIHARRK